MSTTPSYDVVIVGAGHNGLVTAFYLARADRSVLILERAADVGGACVTEALIPGYRFSTCASILWQLQTRVEDDLELRRHGLTYERGPGGVALFPDNERLVRYRDPEQLREEVRRLSSHDADHLDEWRAFWDKAASLIHPFFLRDPPSEAELRLHAVRQGTSSVLDALKEKTTQQICDEFFEDERVKASLVSVEDVGAWAPGSAVVEAWWHTSGFNRVMGAFPRGGMGSVTQAMARAAMEAGATIITGIEVEAILCGSGRATGVRCRDGRTFAADVVVSNADPKRTVGLIQGELPDATSRFGEAAGWTTEVSYQKFHGVLRRLPDLRAYSIDVTSEPEAAATIKIAPSLAVYKRAFEAAKAGELPEVPAIGGMFIPSIFDSSLAKAGTHTVEAWILYAPTKLRGGSWEDARRAAGRRFIARVTEFIPNFSDALEDWMMLLPVDFEQRHGMTDGNIRHLDVTPGQFLANRPAAGWGYRTPLEGLYLCGAGTHPGGEVTGANGFNAARTVLNDWGEREAASL